MKETQSLPSWGLQCFRGDWALVYTTRQTGVGTVRSNCILWGGAQSAVGTQEGSEDEVTSPWDLEGQGTLEYEKMERGFRQKKIPKCFFHVTVG